MPCHVFLHSSVFEGLGALRGGARRGEARVGIRYDIETKRAIYLSIYRPRLFLLPIHHFHMEKGTNRHDMIQHTHKEHTYSLISRCNMSPSLRATNMRLLLRLLVNYKVSPIVT